MARITRAEQLEERRTRVWELYNQGFTHTEIANNHLHYPRRTISNDVSFMKRKRDEERRKKAEQQEHEALEVIEEERVTMKILKKQAITDMSQLSIKDLGQRDLRVELYQIIGQLSDSRVELALVSDRLEQKEALQRVKAKTDSMMLRLDQIEEVTGVTATTTKEKKEEEKDNAGLLQEESKIV